MTMTICQIAISLDMTIPSDENVLVLFNTNIYNGNIETF